MEKSFTAQLGAASLVVACPFGPLCKVLGCNWLTRCAQARPVCRNWPMHDSQRHRGSCQEMKHPAPAHLSYPYSTQPSTKQLGFRPQHSVLPGSALSVPPWTGPPASSCSLAWFTHEVCG